MYSEFRLDVELSKDKKITDIDSIYKIHIVPPVDLSQSFYEY